MANVSGHALRIDLRTFSAKQITYRDREPKNHFFRNIYGFRFFDFLPESMSNGLRQEIDPES